MNETFYKKRGAEVTDRKKFCNERSEVKPFFESVFSAGAFFVVSINIS